MQFHDSMNFTLKSTSPVNTMCLFPLVNFCLWHKKLDFDGAQHCPALLRASPGHWMQSCPWLLLFCKGKSYFWAKNAGPTLIWKCHKNEELVSINKDFKSNQKQQKNPIKHQNHWQHPERKNLPVLPLPQQNVHSPSSGGNAPWLGLISFSLSCSFFEAKLLFSATTKRIKNVSECTEEKRNPW